MDLQQIAETLAKKHDMSKEEFFSRDVATVYPVDRRENWDFHYLENRDDIWDNQTLVQRWKNLTGSSGQLGNSYKFMEEFNEELNKSGTEDYELAYVLNIINEGSIKGTDFLHLNLIHKSTKNFISLREKGDATEVELYCKGYVSGSVIASDFDGIWFTSDSDNPTMNEVFGALQCAYDDIQKVVSR